MARKTNAEVGGEKAGERNGVPLYRVREFKEKPSAEVAAKFVERLCEVPAWSAFVSCIIASIEYVRKAPANFSLSLFCPG